jgi:hypothetical protein
MLGWLLGLALLQPGLIIGAHPASGAAPNHPLAAINPSPQSRAETPIDQFREMLAADPAERERILAIKPESKRREIKAKLQEYEAMAPDERELRLQVLQLRWYLLPLMEVPASNRVERLAAIPSEYRRLAEERLAQWDLLPPPLQKQALENATTRHYFIRLEQSSPAERQALLDAIPPERRRQLEEGLAVWHALPAAQRQKMYAQFDQFFELTEEEKEKALRTLSHEERQQMEQTLRTFNQLPRAQRQLCIASFSKFDSLSPSERAQFLRNAERWREMSPTERKTWRELVTALPPLPPGMAPYPQPPLPPQLQQTGKQSLPKSARQAP